MERLQSLQDKILWELTDYRGKLARSVLKQRVGIIYADLESILEERGGMER